MITKPITGDNPSGSRRWRTAIHCVLSLVVLLASVYGGGCAAPGPLGPPLGRVHRDVEAHIGEEVRWLGTVRRATAEGEGTEVVVEGLMFSARETSEDLPPLFVVTVPGRIQHSLRRGQEVTVRGTISGRRNADLPVVEAVAIYRGPGTGERVWPEPGQVPDAPSYGRY